MWPNTRYLCKLCLAFFVVSTSIRSFTKSESFVFIIEGFWHYCLWNWICKTSCGSYGSTSLGLMFYAYQKEKAFSRDLNALTWFQFQPFGYPSIMSQRYLLFDICKWMKKCQWNLFFVSRKQWCRFVDQIMDQIFVWQKMWQIFRIKRLSWCVRRTIVKVVQDGLIENLWHYKINPQLAPICNVSRVKHLTDSWLLHFWQATYRQLL